MTGHSLGGKAALLAATMDPRVRATITLDPVDTSGFGCDPAECPDVSAMMPLDIPTAFLGETTDAAGGFQPCAPAADNSQTFYAGTTAPSLEVTVVGANHMSFLDDAASCGFTCSVCNEATAANAAVNNLARAYGGAFYQRHLKGIAAYDAYLTGAEAQARYVEPGLITIQSK
jgi:pimeloyl-ACP methyl ester carboxylesterase